MAHVWEVSPRPRQSRPPIHPANPIHPDPTRQDHSQEAAGGSQLNLAATVGQQSHSIDGPNRGDGNRGRDLQQPQAQAQDTANPDPGAFQCGFCKKSYTRPDHLIRHVRSHTQEKPYVCPVCQKGFARPDLVKRHAAAHNDESHGPEQQSKKRRLTQLPSTSRVTQACKACSSSKLKCTEEKPCSRCRQKGLDCEYPYSDNSPSSGLGSDQNQSSITAQSESHVMRPTRPPTAASSRPIQIPSPENLNQNATDPSLSASSSEGVLELDGTYYPGFYRELVMPSSVFSRENTINQQYPRYMSSLFPPHGFMDYGTCPTSVAETYASGDFPIFDFPTAPDYNSASTAIAFGDEMHSGSAGPDSTVALGAEAFMKSSLSGWVPTPQDDGYAEDANLSLPDHASRTADTRQFTRQRIIESPLTLSTRDQILSIVLEVCRPNNVSRVISGFPSVDLFDNVIQLYFDHHTKQLDTWLHLPTFDPNDSRPELVTAIAGAGAVRSDYPVVQRLGYALQESLRKRIPLSFDDDNTRVRALKFHQAYCLQIEVRLWSGARRKIEVAESLLQPVITMMRRGRRFKRSGGHLIAPKPEDEGYVLEEIWRAWVEQESRKRLAFHVFLHDAQSSITLNTNPLISYAELSLPLPRPLNLWQAPDSPSWKRLYLGEHTNHQSSSNQPDRLPSLTEVLQDMSLLSAFSQDTDIQLSRLVVLHALWALIWEHRQLNTLSHGQSGPWSELVLSSRHSEISLAIQHFRMSSTNPPMAPDVRLVLECISMHLYMSLDELELYAGKEDKGEARQAYYSARSWIDSSASRHAVWHAGQVIRAARSFRPNTLRDFYAIAVYHASLAFWSYGVVHRATENEPEHPSHSHSHGGGPLQQLPIYLDGEETPELEMWTTHKSRKPLLTITITTTRPERPSPQTRAHGKAAAASLIDEPATVMEAVREVLGGNWTQEPVPPLVENLRQLMGDLGRAAAGGGGPGPGTGSRG